MNNSECRAQATLKRFSPTAHLAHAFAANPDSYLDHRDTKAMARAKIPTDNSNRGSISYSELHPVISTIVFFIRLIKEA